MEPMKRPSICILNLLEGPRHCRCIEHHVCGLTTCTCFKSHCVKASVGGEMPYRSDDLRGDNTAANNQWLTNGH